MKNVFLIFMVVLMVFACSKKSGSGGGKSTNTGFGPGGNKPNDGGGPASTGKGETCLFAGGDLCVEFTGSQWDSNQIQIVCADYQGTIAQVSCKAGGIIAECILNKGLQNEAVMKYYTPITRDNAALDCDRANGIFR
jgi:hypothetical protein